MASLLSFQPYQARIHLPNQTRIHLPTQTRIRTRFTGSLFHLRGSVGLTRVNSSHFHHQLDEILYTLADATSAVQESKPKEDWFTGIASYMEIILKILKDGLSTLHVPYAYGFAIIFLTILVKAATFPLTKKQVESAIAMRSLQPQVKSIQKRFAGDQERIQIETARLYKLAGVNPLAGCLPTLLTIPVWIGLYRALSNVANEGLLSEGFFWIPSLAGPTTIAKSSGISWLFPFIDGEPPLGWSDTFAYLVLPILLIISQYISTQVMQASQPQSDDQSQQSAQIITKFLPLLIGYFALSVPSGLSLYWLTNNILSTTQQIWLQKLGGAKNPVKDYMEKVSKDDKSPIIDISKPNIEISNPNFEDSNSDLVPRGESFKQIKEKDADERGKRFRQLKEEEARKKKQKEQEKMTQNETNNDNNNNINNTSLKEELKNNNGNNNITEDSNNLNGSSLKDIIATEQINELRDQETKKDDA